MHRRTTPTNILFNDLYKQELKENFIKWYAAQVKAALEKYEQLMLDNHFIKFEY